jgi:hypothetical protein
LYELSPTPTPDTLNMKKTVLSILLFGAALAQAEPVATALKVGDSIPDVTVRTVDNKEVKLRTLVAEKPAVLVFFGAVGALFAMRISVRYWALSRTWTNKECKSSQ